MSERLFAPWRLEYLAEDHQGCAFCDAAHAAKTDPASARVLHVSAHTLTLVNKYPYGYGHILVCPLRHEADLSALSTEERRDFFDRVVAAEQIVRTALNAHGINMGMNLGKSAGAGIADHLHMHLVPRWIGDTNFMPVIADCRVIPASLDDLYAALRSRFEEAPC